MINRARASLARISPLLDELAAAPVTIGETDRRIKALLVALSCESLVESQTFSSGSTGGLLISDRCRELGLDPPESTPLTDREKLRYHAAPSLSVSRESGAETVGSDHLSTRPPSAVPSSPSETHGGARARSWRRYLSRRRRRMTVKQLIAKLQKLPPASRVVIEKATGGECSASPLDAVQAGHYRADSTWAGDVKHPDDVEQGDEAVVVLWPVN